MYRSRPQRRYRSAATKYSNETVSFNYGSNETVPAGTTVPYENEPPTSRGVTIVAPTEILGNRKCKNFTIKVTANGNNEQIFGALVYVPEGTIASPLAVTGQAQSIYEPNQNVICTFIIPPNCIKNPSTGELVTSSAPTQITVNSPLARNLNTGDKIVLLFAAPQNLYATGTSVLNVSGTVNFAIKF